MNFRDDKYRAASRVRASASRKGSKRPVGMDPSTGVRYYADDETEFLAAVEAYQRAHTVRFPTACMYLQILLSLGYSKFPASSLTTPSKRGAVKLMNVTLSPVTQSILQHLSNLPGEIADHVNLVELEATVAAALASGQGLAGVLTAVLANASKIFVSSTYASRACKLLTSSQALIDHHVV